MLCCGVGHRHTIYRYQIKLNRNLRQRSTCWATFQTYFILFSAQPLKLQHSVQLLQHCQNHHTATVNWPRQTSAILPLSFPSFFEISAWLGMTRTIIRTYRFSSRCGWFVLRQKGLRMEGNVPDWRTDVVLRPCWIPKREQHSQVNCPFEETSDK